MPPALTFLCRQSDLAEYHYPSHHLSLPLSLSAHTSGPRWRVKLQLCFSAEKLCSILFLISPSCSLGPQQKYALCKFMSDVVKSAVALSVQLVSLTKARSRKNGEFKVTRRIRLPCSAQKGQKHNVGWCLFSVVLINFLSFVLFVLHPLSLLNFL